MYFARVKRLTETLRFRLVVWNVSVVLLIALLILFGYRQSVHLALVAGIDDVLLQDMQEIRLALRDSTLKEVFESLERKAEAHTLTGWYARVRDKNHRPIFATPGAPSPLLQRPIIEDDLPAFLGEFRIIQHHHMKGTPSEIVVRIGSSLNRMHEDLGRIDQSFYAVFAMMLLAAPAFGYWMADRSIQPLRSLVDAIHHIHPNKLDERLPNQGAGDEPDQLSRSFNALLDQISDYLKRKQIFLSNAAHELRTPITAIRCSAELSLTESRTQQEYEDVIGGIIEECSALEVLVNQLLLLGETHLVALRGQGEALRLDRLVHKAHDMFSAVAEVRGIQIQLRAEEPVYVEGDAHHLRQVLNNLIDNAIKFTPEGGRITIELTCNFASNQVVLLVSDTGEGIPESELPLVFDRFFRGGSTRSRQSRSCGYGLGLSICAEVVRSHRGEIEAQSEVGVGTTFKVTFPRANQSDVLSEAPSRVTTITH